MFNCLDSLFFSFFIYWELSISLWHTYTRIWNMQTHSCFAKPVSIRFFFCLHTIQVAIFIFKYVMISPSNYYYYQMPLPHVDVGRCLVWVCLCEQQFFVLFYFWFNFTAIGFFFYKFSFIDGFVVVVVLWLSVCFSLRCWLHWYNCCRFAIVVSTGIFVTVDDSRRRRRHRCCCHCCLYCCCCCSIGLHVCNQHHRKHQQMHFVPLPIQFLYHLIILSKFTISLQK